MIGFFFYVKGEFLIETIALNKATLYGDNLTMNEGHNDSWEQKYAKKFKKEYDYFPRGRVVYNKTNNQYTIYSDKCIPNNSLDELIDKFELKGFNITYSTDIHYSCHNCNPDYVDIEDLYI